MTFTRLHTAQLFSSLHLMFERRAKSYNAILAYMCGEQIRRTRTQYTSVDVVHSQSTHFALRAKFVVELSNRVTKLV